jgi:AraC family transcriptional regulator, regulatory protein of adaptative response / methylated-DNA-[protein]-cysteine methyltransferase
MNEVHRIEHVCRHIERNVEEPLRLADLAALAAMSRYHFARRFKAIVGVTPKQYVAYARLRRFKGGLNANHKIDSAIYASGYGSSSRIYEKAGLRLGMTPAQYRNAGEGVAISYAVLSTPVGLMMIAATDRGICSIAFGDSEQMLLTRLRSEYGNASIDPMKDPAHPQFVAWIEAIRRHLAGEQPQLDLPTDIRATAFQMRVYRHLQTIPYGSVQSYAEVAEAVCSRKAARAVASACARNPVAVLVPCHRVIRESGELGGYRWGLERKRTLIDRERASSSRTRTARAAVSR